jgi:hypothetical protein
MIKNLISKTRKVEQGSKKGEVMGKLLVMGETEMFHRVWNFVVPLDNMGKNNPIQPIPPLTKNSFRKNRRQKTKKRAC